MEASLFDLAKNEVQSLVNLVKKEAQYLCCYNSYAENFDQKKNILAAKHKDMKRKFQKGKGVLSFKYEAQQWEGEANDVIKIDAKIKKTLFFSWFPNCWWQYRRGRKLAEETQHIEELLGRCNSNIVAGRAHLPNIKSLSPQDFIHFKSRESKFQDIMKVLQDGNCNMIGLHGMGGAGKTSMAKEVGQKLKESNLIDKFIFLVVSQPPDFKKIRSELAKELELKSEEVNEEELSSTILFTITNMDEKLLIILDDVWEKFDLTENLGIPNEQLYKGCNLLITTRNLRVCSEMGCQTIELQKLTEEEALDLFEKHATINNSSRGLKGMPKKIVKHCGGVPVAIVAVARALKNQPISVWKDALKTLEDGGVDPNLEEAYKCLKLSYDNLQNKMAKELLLISSLFPEDTEIPLKFLIKIGIGLSSFIENDKYHLKRNEVHGAIMELIYSSLLLNGEEESVKVHDLVREVALKIGDKDVQSLVDSEMPIKGNLRYLFWKNDVFPDKFDGNKLEVLSTFLDDSEDVNVSDAFFKDMAGLKVLALFNSDFGRIPSLSLTKSLQQLKNIRTLILASLELGDIIVLGNLLSLRTLWFYDCSINEFPREFLKLNKLRSLEVEDCEIEKNNPFEVIESCSQLEELTFVGNECDSNQKDEISKKGSPLEISKKGSPLTLHKYCISSMDLSNYFEKYGSMSRCFRIDELSHFVSDSTFKQLVVRAELLILEGEDAQKIWKNLIPDIVPIDEGGILNDLIVLHLSSCPNLECLVDTRDHESGVIAFCNLAELHLSEMHVEDLCQGPPPYSFLEQLEIMKLKKCHELKRILPNGDYNLCYLKSMKLEDCPKLTLLFQPSTARSLKQLEKLTIRNCNELEYIVVGEDGDSNQESYCGSLFPNLKIFQIACCNKLRIILPILFAGGLASLEKISIHESDQLQYIFDKFQEGKDAILPSLKEMELSEVPSFIGIFREYHQLKSSSKETPSPQNNSNKINQNPAARAFSWVQACCSLNRSRHASNRSFDHTNPLELDASTDGVPPFHAALCLLVQSLKNVREIKLVKCQNLISLTTLSIASSTIALENLIIHECHKLKCIATYEGDAEADKNNCSIFPRLANLEIEDCKELEFLVVSAISAGLENLKSLTVEKVPELKYVIGNYQKEQNSFNQNHIDELHFDLPVLETLVITNAPQFNGICIKSHKMVLSSLQKIEIRNCGIKSFTDHNMVNWRITEELDASTDGVPPFHAAQSLLVQSLKNVSKIKLVECWNLISLSTLSIASSTFVLENLIIRECRKLKCITTYEGDAEFDKNHCSIFPRLENLEIEYCEELEFLFVSTISVGLENLKSLTIKEVPKLKYAVGDYQEEQPSSHRNQNEELHFDVPTLETLFITNAPKMNSICAKNYKMVLSSPLDVEIWNCGIKFFTDHNMMNWRTIEKFDASTYRVPTFHTAQSLLVQSLKNVSKLKLVECWNLISLSTLSIAASTISLENLVVRECHQLKCITTHVGDAEANKNYYSIFPRLETLEIEDCKELEFLFVSAISVGLEKLKSLTIEQVPELKYVVRNYQQEQHSSNQDQNEELHFDLPVLETLIITNAPKINGVSANNYRMVLSSLQEFKIRNCQYESFSDHNLVNWRTTEEIDASTDGDPLFHVAQILLVQSLKTVKEIELVECWNLISLSTISIAGSIMALQNLTIRGCDKLKCITANEGVAQADKYCSIFPRLEKLKIEDCEELEFLFVSAISVGLENLKSLIIEELPELKYIVGNYQKEQHSSNQNQIGELHFDLPSLETLYIEDAPKMNSMCAKNYKLLLSSPLNVQIRNCGIKSFTAQEAHTSTNGAHPLFHAAQSLLIQSLKSIRNMELANCESLISVSTLSIISTILLENLTITKCHRLKYIVADEGGAGTHMNYNSIFPKLKELQVSDCDALEYLFPAHYFGSPLYLESLSIHTAPMLKYVFGRSQYEDNLTHENQIISQTLIDFPALNDLSIKDVPQLASICPENYYLRGLSLRSIAFGGLPMFLMRPCNAFLAFFHTKQQQTKAIEMRLQTLEKLVVDDSKIEEIFDLTHVDIEKNGHGLEPLTASLQELELRNLSELVNLCVGPKRIMRFHSLQKLSINSSKKLKVIFSTSMVRSLPMLKELDISKCVDLVHIVEEDYETNDDHLFHEPCFPNLEQVSVEHCDKLKCLFSVTVSNILPKLCDLDIKKAHELEHVLIRRGEMKQMVMEDVLPHLRWLTLEELPNLISICHGIDFQTLADQWGVNIRDCPNFSFYETLAAQLQICPESVDSKAEEKAKEKLSSHQSTEQYSNMGDATQLSLTKEVSIHTSPNLTDLHIRDNTHSSVKIVQEEDEEEDDVQVCDKSPPHSSIYKEEGEVQNESKSNVEQSNLTQRNQESSYSKDSQPRTAMATTPFVTVSKDESLKDELISKDVEKETNRMDPHSLDGETGLDIQSKETKNIVVVKAEEGTPLETSHPSSLTSKKEPIPVSPKPAILPRSPSRTAKIFEEKENGDPVVPPELIISSEQASKTILPWSLVLSKALTSPKQIPMSTTPSEPTAYGKNIQENIGTTSQPLHEASGPFQISSQLAVMSPPICETNNALSVAGVKEIVDMMKLEGIEPSLLAEAFMTIPQLRLSSEDRSTELLCYSYKVLLNILNILATRCPFTITEVDKRLLAKYLKDASILGFDKDWLESIRIKVFNNCDVSGLHHVQELLKSLGIKLQANKIELANVRYQEAKAAKSVEMAQKKLEATHKELDTAYKALEAAQSHFNVAQQEHAHIRARHSQLLEECQEILEQRDQYSEIIAAKLRPFAF